MCIRFVFIAIFLIIGRVFGQDDITENLSCYGPGSIAASVILTLILTILLQCVLYVIWKRYWKNRTENHLVLETDPEKGRKEDYAFDNAAFGDSSVTLADKSLQKSNSSTVKSRWSRWSPLGTFITRNEKQKTLDDSFLQGEEIKTVSLKSHDFTGLGFNIHGNMRDGIFIKDILNRGPASQSRKLCPGDRIQRVTINFEHVVYEDALTILSYASPYEVILEVKSGRLLWNSHNHSRTKTVQLGHPLYRSSSVTDLKSTKKRLFSANSSIRSSYSDLQKPSNNRSKSPPSTLDTYDTKKKTSQQLRSQLEQNFSQNHEQQLKAKEAQTHREREPDVTKLENKYQKFGIKVLPLNSKEQISPKSSELSQNDNNINLERTVGKDSDEELKETFVRQCSTTGSGIKRDKDGIPQEIPNHILNAAVAARNNRRVSKEDIVDGVKSPKKLKGKAPAPPEKPSEEITVKSVEPSAGYNSDSDAETDNLSSVNTIELNASDITIHQSEQQENQVEEEILSRKTASTGDLTKIQKARKTSSGTLERAQSLDITDSGIPVLSKKRKGGSIGDSKTSSNDSLYGKALIHKEPRLSLALDGLNTFQRSRLKKSTEWGNLEDAVFNLGDRDDDENKRSDIEFDALVNKIKEIKKESFISHSEHRNGNDEIDHHRNEEETQEKTSSFVWRPSAYKVTRATETLLLTERQKIDQDPFYSKALDVNASDDLKVSTWHMDKPNHEDTNETSTQDIEETTATTSSPDLIKNLILTEAICDINETVTIDGPTSFTLEIPSDKKTNSNVSTATVTSKPNYSLTYITEIQVTTPEGQASKNDPEQELYKIREKAEEQLKKLPEMRFTTTNYEPPSATESYTSSHIEQLRSNFEKSPPKSRIPVATIKTPPTSPERRDSRNFDLEVDKEIVAVMSSPLKYQPKNNKNVSITSIRSNSKIPSGLSSSNNRPPVPPRKYENEGTNGNTESFKQWLFNPGNINSVTNVTITDKTEQ